MATDRVKRMRRNLLRAMIGATPFPEMMVNGNLNTGDLTGYTVQTLGTGTTEYLNGAIHLVGTDASNRGRIRQTITTFIAGRTYRLSFARAVASGVGIIGISSSPTNTTHDVLQILTSGATSGTFVATATTLYFAAWPSTSGADFTLDNISIRRLS